MPNIGESIQVWVVRLVGQTAESWRPVLSNDEWQKAMRFRFEADQVRSAVTRGVLRTLLSRYLDRPRRSLIHGKRIRQTAIEGIEFNVSHSGDYSLLAFSPNARIGVDVEHIRDKRAVQDLSRRVLTPTKYVALTPCPTPLASEPSTKSGRSKSPSSKPSAAASPSPPKRLRSPSIPIRHAFSAPKQI